MRHPRATLLLCAALLFAACGGGDSSTAKNGASPDGGDGGASGTQQIAKNDPPTSDDDASVVETIETEDAVPEPPPAPEVNLADPGDPAFKLVAPDAFKARFKTSKGDFVIEVTRDWAPHGADRFHNLVKAGYYDDTRFFRVIEGFMAQFGLHGDPAVNTAWEWAQIPDDAVIKSNTRGMLSFATRGPNTRTTQLFINFVDNTNLDRMGFSPFGQVVEGMDVVDSLYNGYGEGAPRGLGPNQMLIMQQGNTYLDAKFPQLDKILAARIE
ncbi:MAG: peptidylprolyl isomerase [Planctomycetota bacterium]|jgi:peptidyl-prolyl cis-trans isomerase A (cyclophilin A)